MIQYNILNVKLSNSQVNKLKSRTKNGTEVILKLSSNVVGDSNDEHNFPHQVLLTNTQVSKIRKVFADGSSPNINFSKTQLSKMIQSGGIMTGIPGIDNFISFPFKIENPYLIELSNTDTKKINKNNRNNTFIDAELNMIGKKIKKKNWFQNNIYKQWIKDIKKIIKSLENRGISLKGTTRKNNNQEGWFLNFLKPFMTSGLRLMKNVLAPLAKSVLIPLELTATALATDAAIWKKIFGSGKTVLILSN